MTNGNYSQQLTEEEKQMLRDIPITDILGLHARGRSVCVKCVFHNDRSPSLSISPNNLYNCFGCGKSGSGAIDFLIDLGYTYQEAIKELQNL